jgi:hypothetical protein
MKSTHLSSCSNCWYNSVQYGSIGLPFGYCVEHQCILRQPDELTCGKHMRKDVLLGTARVFSNRHLQNYAHSEICKLEDASLIPKTDTIFIQKNLAFLRRDPVGSVVADYGAYDTKIESIAQLRFAAKTSIRAEIAMLNLGRSYVARCVARDGSWKSGIHILWWVKEFFQQPMPEINPNDLIYQTATSLDRQIELAKWSVLILRLTYISDIGEYAQRAGDGNIGALRDIAEEAALATEKPNLRKLEKWVRSNGMPKIDSILPESTYTRIGRSLHAQ